MKFPKRILLIEDDEDDRQFFIDAVKGISSSIICKTAADGLTGLEILKSGNPLPDYIFIDLYMPRMNGIEFLKEILHHPFLSSIPIIVYSTTDIEREEAEKLGASAYIVKPSSVSRIKMAIMDVLIPEYKKKEAIFGN